MTKFEDGVKGRRKHVCQTCEGSGATGVREVLHDGDQLYPVWVEVPIRCTDCNGRGIYYRALDEGNPSRGLKPMSRDNCVPKHRS